MSKLLELNAEEEERLCIVGKALSSPTRVQILKLLYYNSYNVGEIAEKLNIPASSAGVHVRILEQAGLINTELQPGNRGAMKLCSRKNDCITIQLVTDYRQEDCMKSFSMPIGAYTDCCVVPTCGLGGENGLLATDDRPGDFYVPERTQAQILWSSGGYVEYKFPYPLPSGVQPKRLILTFEACSEAPNCREDWKSDISVWVNGQDCGIWRCPGDFGQRRGKNNPAWWQNGATQYGLLNTVEITPEHTLTNTRVSSGVTIGDLCLKENIPITVRIGNKEDAEYRGGFNLFGRGFGDYDQDIILTLVY